jgi:hypothetical protein
VEARAQHRDHGLEVSAGRLALTAPSRERELAVADREIGVQARGRTLTVEVSGR